MNLFDALRFGDPNASPGVDTVMLSLLLSFVVGHIIGWIYMTTHASPSYSSSFVASLVVMPVLVALMMILMSGSLFIAFGLLAVFAVVRFRNVLKDTRDTTYILWAIVEGMAAGTFRYTTSLVGAGCVALVLIYLWWTEFGVRHRFDAALSVSVPSDSESVREQLLRILNRFSDRTIMTSERLTDDARSILSYRMLLRDPARRGELQSELAAAGDIQELAFYLQSDELEL
jgi:hypothetical protein